MSPAVSTASARSPNACLNRVSAESFDTYSRPVAIPADTNVVAATGNGYQGTHVDDKTKATVATWKLSRSAPKDQEKLSITLSKAATADAKLSGDIHWTKPSPRNGPSTDVVNIAPAPL